MHEQFGEYNHGFESGSHQFSAGPLRHSPYRNLDPYRLDRIRRDIARGLLSIPEIGVYESFHIYHASAYREVRPAPLAIQRLPSGS